MHFTAFCAGARRAVLLGVLVAAILLPGRRAVGAVESRNILKTYFETGDVPTQEQFANLIDSYIHQTDDGLTLTGIGNEAGTGNAARLGTNVGINEIIPFATLSVSRPAMAPLWAGQSGFLPLKYLDSSLAPHYGFLQIHMDASSLLPPAIHVDYWVWESSANSTLTTFAVPEPGVAMVLTLGAAAAVRRTRRETR